MNSFGVNHNDISLTIKFLESSNAHGCDNTSIKIKQIS